MHIETLAPGEVFVFGSNASGAHGGGAAHFAYARFGAVWGQSEGLQGQSYGIDTMSGLGVFEEQAGRFLAFADEHPELRFLVTEVGCGIAGYRPVQVAGFFRGAGANVVLPETFTAVLAQAGEFGYTCGCRGFGSRYPVESGAVA